jgi:hypothetical protein
MDAYDGTMTFYVADPNDPIIQAWEGVFPTVYHPLTDMSLRSSSAPALSRRSLRRPDDASSRSTTSPTRASSTRATTCGRWLATRHERRNGPQQLGLEAYYVEMQARARLRSATPSSCCCSRWFRTAGPT